jgi:hypothetical protein
LPEHRSRLIFDLDSTVVTSFGHHEGAEVGYNPHYRGKHSYDPLLGVEANSSFLWDVERRLSDARTWAGCEELLACCFLSSPSDILEFRAAGGSGLRLRPVLDMLESRPTAQYAVVARMTPSLKRELGGLRYEQMNARVGRSRNLSTIPTISGSFSADLSTPRMAESDLEQAPAQTLLAAGEDLHARRIDLPCD